MNNYKFFEDIDKSLSNILLKKTSKDYHKEILEETEKKRDKLLNNFNLSKDFGKIGEKLVRTFLEEKGYVFLENSLTNETDYIFLKNNKEYTFEIKTDISHFRENNKGVLSDTGNIAIEYESRGKPSGLSTTQADFFVTYFPILNEIWLIKTKELKDLIKEKQKSLKKVEGGDIGSETKMFLIPRENYRDKFRVANVV